jgi:hypothetical protein
MATFGSTSGLDALKLSVKRLRSVPVISLLKLRLPSEGLKLVDLAEVSRRAIPPEFFDDQSGCQEVLSFSTHLDCRISETHSISLFNLLPTFAYGAASVTKVLLMWTTKSTLPSLKMDVLSVH